MAVRTIRKSWWVDFRVDHTRYRRRSPENSRSGALAYEAMLRQKLARGESVERRSDETDKAQGFEQFALKWFEEYVVPNNKYSEQRIKKYVLSGALIPFFGKIPVGQITGRHIEQYKARRVKDGLANKTIRNHLTVLSKCLVTAYEWLELDSKPPKIQWPKCPPPQTDYLSSDECELLLSHASSVVREMMLMALRTGMRQGELKGLQWSSIDWQNMNVTVRHSRCDRAKALVSPKSNRMRHIPLDADVYELLYRRRRNTGYVFSDADEEPFNHDRLSYQMEKVCKKAGLRRITWHVLRHTFASHLAMRGVPLHIVQTLLGHSTITMTMRYTHVAPSALRSAIDALNPRRLIALDHGQPAGNWWTEETKQNTTDQIPAPVSELNSRPA